MNLILGTMAMLLAIGFFCATLLCIQVTYIGIKHFKDNNANPGVTVFFILALLICAAATVLLTIGSLTMFRAAF